jgi:hypothetical protein
MAHAAYVHCFDKHFALKLLFGLLLIFASTSGIAPFIYTLF